MSFELHNVIFYSDYLFDQIYHDNKELPYRVKCNILLQDIGNVFQTIATAKNFKDEYLEHLRWNKNIKNSFSFESTPLEFTHDEFDNIMNQLVRVTQSSSQCCNQKYETHDSDERYQEFVRSIYELVIKLSDGGKLKDSDLLLLEKEDSDVRGLINILEQKDVCAPLRISFLELLSKKYGERNDFYHENKYCSMVRELILDVATKYYEEQDYRKAIKYYIKLLRRRSVEVTQKIFILYHLSNVYQLIGDQRNSDACKRSANIYYKRIRHFD